MRDVLGSEPASPRRRATRTEHLSSIARAATFARMLRLHHGHASRSSRILWLLEELGADYEIAYTDIPRRDGSGAPDPSNPHPDKKVPALVHDDALVTESIAIILYLTDLFPGSGIGPAIGEPGRGEYLTWLAYYAGVIEPVMTFGFAELGDHPVLQRTFRGRAEVDQRVLAALEESPYILGESFSAVDLLLGSSGLVFRQLLPEGKKVDEWLERIAARPARARANAKDAAPS